MFELTSKNAVDIDALKIRLCKMQIGEVITYDQISEVIGRNIRKDGKRGIAYQAMNQLLSEQRFVFGTIRNVGFKRLNADETVESTKDGMTRIRKISRKQVKRLSAVDYGSISTNALKVQHNASISLYGAIAFAADSGNLKRLTTTNGNRPEGLPTAETLRRLAS